jgi:GNAT superfamily N-acetyltransferase
VTAARIERLDPERHAEVVDGLADVLVDCVEGGASVGFLAGLRHEDARTWWRAALGAPEIVTWIALDAEGVAGVVRLQPAGQQDAPHRAGVHMVLVHRRARGRGVAAALLAQLEREALARGRWLLVLDTQTGSPAEAVYRRLGWQPAGVIPDHTLDPAGVPTPTTFFWKDLRQG